MAALANYYTTLTHILQWLIYMTEMNAPSLENKESYCEVE